jgi:hypothetical protein
VRFKLNHSRWTKHHARVDAAVAGVYDDFRAAVRKEALLIKTDWAAQWGPSRHLPYLGASISYDTTHAATVHTAEIGPDKLRRQGPLGTIIEDANGGARNRATHAGNKAGRRAESRFANAVERAAAEGIGG